MIVRHFLQWVRTAAASERADATSALARAFLHSDLSVDDRIAAEGALVMLLDDPSPLVRLAMAQALAASADAPAPVIFALAADQAEIASLVLESSPLLLDADLVDSVGSGESATQAAVARRRGLPRAVAAAIAEVGSPEACLTLIENDSAEVAPFSIDRIVERHGQLAAIREALLARGSRPGDAPGAGGAIVETLRISWPRARGSMPAAPSALPRGVQATVARRIFAAHRGPAAGHASARAGN